jgi:hypothetical protein
MTVISVTQENSEFKTSPAKLSKPYLKSKYKTKTLRAWLKR